MVKKLPILLSTLTVLAGSLSAASVSAVSETGPWSFDELTAAKNEVDAEASTQCTDSFTRAACINSIMESKGGIYYTGLWKFRYNQFTPLSMNFATGELAYYYNSTNEYRKINNKRPYLKDYLTKLFIVQVEQGYDNWAADLRAGVKDSEHWQVLYDGAITEEGTSLLPYDQKATLTIGAPSFDSKYEKYLRVLYTDTFSDSAEINTYDFTACAEGRKCDAWYDATNPFLFFKDFSYTEGYNAGYSEGFDYGKLIGQGDGYYGGYDTGYGDGYNNGYTDGYINGQNDGRTEGYNEGSTSGYNSGHTEGYQSGYNDGRVNGINEGYENGYSIGHDDGVGEGYNYGYTAGHEDGINEGYQNGYLVGYESGRTEGYEAGQNDGYNAGYANGQSDGYENGYTNGQNNGYETGYNNGYEAGSVNNNEIQDSQSNTDDAEQSRDNVNNASEQGDDQHDENNYNNTSESTNSDEAGNSSTTNSLTINNALPSSSIIANNTNDSSASKQDLAASKSTLTSPDTGAPTAEKGTGTNEFPWWIGAISLITLTTLVWFFGPKRKNHKKINKNLKKV